MSFLKTQIKFFSIILKVDIFYEVRKWKINSSTNKTWSNFEQKKSIEIKEFKKTTNSLQNLWVIKSQTAQIRHLLKLN